MLPEYAVKMLSDLINRAYPTTSPCDINIQEREHYHDCLSCLENKALRYEEIKLKDLLICPICKSNKISNCPKSSNMIPMNNINFICRNCLYEF